MSSGNSRILIVGAGPVGLAAALELTRNGLNPVIIDRNAHRSVYSKAIGINPRTLELLETSGVSERLISAGRKIFEINFIRDGSVVFTLKLSDIHHRYNYIIALPQSETEEIIEQRLNELGVAVQRNTNLVALHSEGRKPKAKLSFNAVEFEQEFDYVLGTDGAHSTVRKELGIDFIGSNIAGEWSLADIRMQNPYKNSANIFLTDSGFIMMLEFKESVFRIASNSPEVTSRLPGNNSIEEILWKTDFKVSHRQVSGYSYGSVFLAGDAAHIHSPLGGRGMNMGIEDACCWAELYLKSELDHYSAKRHKEGKNIIRMVKALTYIISNTNPIMRLVFTRLSYYLLKFDSIHNYVVSRLTGLK